LKLPEEIVYKSLFTGYKLVCGQSRKPVNKAKEQNILSKRRANHVLEEENDMAEEIELNVTLDDDSGGVDSGGVDSDNVDSGGVDSENVDSGNVDSGNVDSGNVDSGNVDSGNVDSGNVDSDNVDSDNVDSDKSDSNSDEEEEVKTLFK
jgi:hypothetical protein